MKVSLIIPAYNEAKNIGANLDILQEVKGIDEFIVVDDGSTDDTAKIVRSYPFLTLITHEQNKGKLEAVCSGIEKASHENIAFYDADLIGMKAEYVEEMVEKFKEGYDMVIMDKGGQHWAYRKLYKSIPAESGTRIMRKKDFYAIDFGLRRSYDLEPKISRYYIENDLRIGFVKAETAKDPRKYIKYSFLRGFYLHIMTIWQVLSSEGFFGMSGVVSDVWTIARMYRLGIDRPSKCKRKANLKKFFQFLRSLFKRPRLFRGPYTSL